MDKLLDDNRVSYYTQLSSQPFEGESGSVFMYEVRQMARELGLRRQLDKTTVGHLFMSEQGQCIIYSPVSWETKGLKYLGDISPGKNWTKAILTNAEVERE